MAPLPSDQTSTYLLESDPASVTADGNFRYFAIGSMVNPISMSLRNMVPISSEPAELLNHRIGFFSSLGFACPVPDDRASFHGVVHVLPPEQMKRLDTGESSVHSRTTATARFYDGREEQVTVYVRKDNNDPNAGDASLPHQRYIEIMIDGCLHHGVDPQYIEHLKSLETIPRPAPESYLTFGEPPEDQFMTLEEVLQNDGSDGKPLYFVMNKKVITTLMDKASEDYRETSTMFRLMGRIGDLLMARIAYDPKYGVPNSLDEFTPEHSAYCENNFCHYLQSKKILDRFQPVARLQG